jgi:hypothetical protein
MLTDPDPAMPGIIVPSLQQHRFKTPVTAYRTLKGIEAMHALRKGQGRIFAYGHSNPDVVIVEKAFTYA